MKLIKLMEQYPEISHMSTKLFNKKRISKKEAQFILELNGIVK